MPGQRAKEVERNVHFVNADNDEIGGAWQNGSLTWAGMIEWMQIMYQLPLDTYAPFPCLEDGDPEDPVTQHGEMIKMRGNQTSIQPGFFVLLSSEGGPIDLPVNEESPRPRALTLSLSDPDPRWRSGSWQHQLSDDEYLGQTGIHSTQNGIRMRSDVHEYFNKYMLAINPDNDYKTICFVDNPALDGVTMSRNADAPESHQPSRALLKHHSQMAVLLNMKARAGYPEWDEDMPEGHDRIAEIAKSEQAKLRLETVMSGKLNSLIS
ncbi:MAG: hypothetical protein M4579_004699 [Chaenotheca gracillima]|nr:MAG: hypothetical protein M4579_004699 [Chaenotheca gracillima]